MHRWVAIVALLACWVALLAVVVPTVFGADSSPTGRPPTQRAVSDPLNRQNVSIAWGGDITPGSSYGLPPGQGRALFEGVRSDIGSADLALGNLEGTFSVGGASKCGIDGGNCFSFQAPPENAAALAWAGFDALNLANNHAFDFGESGQSQTVQALENNGLAHAGRPGQITVLNRRGLRIALVGFAPYPWATDLRDLKAVTALVRRARARADLVLALAHLGGEGTDQLHTPHGTELAMGEDRGDTRAFARAAVDAGADLVLGSGPHVLRGLELYRGKLIAYSLANFAGWHNFSTAGATSLSGLLTVRLSGTGHFRGGKLVPLRLSAEGVPSPETEGEVVTLINGLSQADFSGRGLRLLPDGSF